MENRFSLSGMLESFVRTDGFFLMRADGVKSSGFCWDGAFHYWTYGMLTCRYVGRNLNVFRMTADRRRAQLLTVTGRLEPVRTENSGQCVCLCVLEADFPDEESGDAVRPNSVVVDGYVVSGIKGNAEASETLSFGISVPGSELDGDLGIEVSFPGRNMAEALQLSKYAAKGHFVRVSGKLTDAGGEHVCPVIEADAVEYISG